MSDLQPFGLIIAVFAGLLFVEELLTLWRAYRSASWSQTTGRITLSSLTPVSLTDRFTTEVQPLIQYHYVVDGIGYQGNTISMGEGWWSFWKRRFPIQDEFPVGSRVTVFYNPARPSQSALLVGAEMSTYLRPVAVALFVIAGLKLLFSRG